MDDLRDRLANRVQLTSDGHRAYLEAVEGAFGGDVDYAQLVKLYGAAPESAKGRYSPAECIGARKDADRGQPRSEARQHVLCRAPEPHHADADAPVHAADQCVLEEIREPHAHGRALHRLVQLREAAQDAEGHRPAMAAGISETLWSMTDLAEMVDAAAEAGKARPVRKRDAA